MTTTKISLKNRFINHVTTKWKTYIFSLVILFSIVTFIYTFGYSTAWARTEVLGKNFTYMQPLFSQSFETNNMLLLLSAGVLFSAVLSLLLGAHNRKKYFWTNYASLGALIGFSLIFTVYLIIASESLKNAFNQSFDTYQFEWEYLIQLAFQSYDMRPDIIASFTSVLSIALINIIVAGLSIWLVIDAALKHATLVAREKEVEDILLKVEKGEIKVTEKVVNEIPSIDDEIIDFTETEILAYEHQAVGRFYQQHKLSIDIAYIWTLMLTSLIFLSIVGSFIIGTLHQMGTIDFTVQSLTGLNASFIEFIIVLLVLVLLFNMSALKAIKQVKLDLTNRSTLLSYGIYLLFTTAISGVLLIGVALKLKPSQFSSDKMRYQNNAFGYTFTFASLIFFIWSLFTSINYSLFTGELNEVRVRPDANVALDISISILLILMMFLAAEKVKTYSKNWSIGLFVISAINILRIFYVPLISVSTNQIPVDIFIQIAISHSISAFLTLIAGVVSFSKSSKLALILKEGGN